jgi:predicted nucleic acid-binding Zn ribbon protein
MKCLACGASRYKRNDKCSEEDRDTKTGKRERRVERKLMLLRTLLRKMVP